MILSPSPAPFPFTDLLIPVPPSAATAQETPTVTPGMPQLAKRRTTKPPYDIGVRRTNRSHLDRAVKQENIPIDFIAQEPVPTASKTTKSKSTKSRGKLTRVYLAELKAIWSLDPRVPSVESRCAWSNARGVIPVLVHRWFSVKKKQAIGAGTLAQGTYELAVDAPHITAIPSALPRSAASTPSPSPPPTPVPDTSTGEGDSHVSIADQATFQLQFPNDAVFSHSNPSKPGPESAFDETFGFLSESHKRIIQSHALFLHQSVESAKYAQHPPSRHDQNSAPVYATSSDASTNVSYADTPSFPAQVPVRTTQSLPQAWALPQQETFFEPVRAPEGSISLSHYHFPRLQSGWTLSQPAVNTVAFSTNSTLDQGILSGPAAPMQTSYAASPAIPHSITSMSSVSGIYNPVGPIPHSARVQSLPCKPEFLEPSFDNIPLEPQAHSQQQQNHRYFAVPNVYQSQYPSLGESQDWGNAFNAFGSSNRPTNSAHFNHSQLPSNHFGLRRSFDTGSFVPPDHTLPQWHQSSLPQYQQHNSVQHQYQYSPQDFSLERSLPLHREAVVSPDLVGPCENVMGSVPGCFDPAMLVDQSSITMRSNISSNLPTFSNPTSSSSFQQYPPSLWPNVKMEEQQRWVYL